MTNRRQQQKEATARRIFEAAITLFTTQSYVATTVEQIVRAAGVAKGTFFTHFASKDALLDHIGAIQMARILAAIQADHAFAARSARARLQLIVQALANGMEAQPSEMRALTSEILIRRSLFDVDRQNISALDQLIAQIIAEGQQRGELRADAPAHRLATLARGAYFLALFEWVEHPELALAPLAAQYLDLTLDGLSHR